MIAEPAGTSITYCKLLKEGELRAILEPPSQGASQARPKQRTASHLKRIGGNMRQTVRLNLHWRGATGRRDILAVD